MDEIDDDELPDRVAVTDVLDLHGFFPEQIPEVIEEFIHGAIQQNLKSLRVIHGKGRSRLKYEVHKALEANPHVARFGDAPTGYGGWGATIIELKPEAEKVGSVS